MYQRIDEPAMEVVGVVQITFERSASASCKIRFRGEITRKSALIVGVSLEMKRYHLIHLEDVITANAYPLINCVESTGKQSLLCCLNVGVSWVCSCLSGKQIKNPLGHTKG